jgi:hypothetical protein
MALRRRQPEDSDPELDPVAQNRASHETPRVLRLRGLRQIGETGFEPATARPPAGAIRFCGVRFSAVERCSVLLVA